MDYMGKTIEMLKQIKNKNFLRIIYYFTKTLYEKEKGD